MGVKGMNMDEATKVDDGGCAFPSEVGNKPEDQRRGMTLRDHFAGLAMQSVASEWMKSWASTTRTDWISKTTDDGDEDSCDMVSRWCYELADAMIAKKREAEVS